ncbi:MAG: D-alanyl-D-alanine carboxypeptidase [Clostridia bacterium]|nr:D-alanyl-D-alanine carboxypeptidase [Clostridia bacterium]
MPQQRPDNPKPHPPGNPQYRSSAPTPPGERKYNSAHIPYPNGTPYNSTSYHSAQNGMSPADYQRAEYQRAELQRRRKIILARRRKRRRNRIFLCIVCILLLAVLITISVSLVRFFTSDRDTDADAQTGGIPVQTSALADTDTLPAETTSPVTEALSAVPDYTAPNMVTAVPITPTSDENTVSLTDEISCKYALLVNCTSGRVTAEKNAAETIYPASMTKLMTVLVAYENIPDLDATFRMTNEIIDPVYLAELSLAGFSGNEDVVIWDLLYGSALPSGAEASVALAIAACGTEEAFVEKMNERAASLGMTGTHFVNCTGAHDDRHVSTLSDIAVLMNYVMQNEDLYTIFSTYQHMTTPTAQHPEGILLTSTVFSRMEGDESLVCTVIGGKTGYTVQAQQCLATYGIREDTGDVFVCVTAGGDTKWRPVYDSIYLYQYHTS